MAEKELLNADANRARLAAAFKEPDNYFSSGMKYPEMTFADGVAPTVRDRMEGVPPKQPEPIDTWNERKQRRG